LAVHWQLSESLVLEDLEDLGRALGDHLQELPALGSLLVEGLVEVLQLALDSPLVVALQLVVLQLALGFVEEALELVLQ